MLCIGIGYFTYDTVAMAYYNLLEGDMIFHHFISVGGMLSVLLVGHGGVYIAISVVIMEQSSLFLHLILNLEHYGMKYTKTYECLYYLFLTLYFERIVPGAHPMYSIVKCKQNHFILKMAAVFLFLFPCNVGKCEEDVDFFTHKQSQNGPRRRRQKA